MCLFFCTINQPFMLWAPHDVFIVAQVTSYGEQLSIIARSELGSDLDCSIINARCYELMVNRTNVLQFQCVERLQEVYLIY